MIPVNNRDEMLDGEYYVCYEIFPVEGIDNMTGNKSLVVGKYVRGIECLIGTLYDSGEIGCNVRWAIYDNFENESNTPKQVQWIFKLIKDEIFQHVVAEEL